MINLPLGNLCHLLRPSRHSRRDGQPQVKVSDVIFGVLLLTAILVLFVEGAANLASALQAGSQGPLQ
jgi:hypothetical protein